MTICRYFLQGNCWYGDRCKFSHADGSQPVTNHSSVFNRIGNICSDSNGSGQRSILGTYQPANSTYSRSSFGNSSHTARSQHTLFNGYNNSFVNNNYATSSHFSVLNYPRNSSYRDFGTFYGSQQSNSRPDVSAFYGSQQSNSRPDVSAFYGSQQSNSRPDVSAFYGSQQSNSRPDVSAFYGSQQSNSRPDVSAFYNNQHSRGRQNLGTFYGNQESGARQDFGAYHNDQQSGARHDFGTSHNDQQSSIKSDFGAYHSNRLSNNTPAMLHKHSSPLSALDGSLSEASSASVFSIEKSANNLAISPSPHAQNLQRSMPAPMDDDRHINTSESGKLNCYDGNQSSGNTPIYSDLKSLTDEEMAEYSAKSFTFGKIPCKPPPQEHCR